MPTVARLIVEGLQRAGVPRLFGVPGGGSNLDLLDAAEGVGLPFVLCHHEWAACIMAAVTGDLIGAPGAAFATLGPGVTASATGLAHAFLDRSPMIYVSDRHPDAVLAFTTHQRVDHAAMLSAIVKGSVTVTADSASHSVAHAVQLALKEPRGPVHLDLPADVSGRPAVPAAGNVTAPLAGSRTRAGDTRSRGRDDRRRQPSDRHRRSRVPGERRQVAPRLLRGAARAVSHHVQGEGRHPGSASTRARCLHGRCARRGDRPARRSDHLVRPRSGRADPRAWPYTAPGGELHALPVEHG